MYYICNTYVIHIYYVCITYVVHMNNILLTYYTCTLYVLHVLNDSDQLNAHEIILVPHETLVYLSSPFYALHDT